MKVLNVCWDDYSNLSFNNAQALQSVGIDCIAVKRVKHPFGYEQEAKVVSNKEMLELCAGADVVQSFHSWNPGFSLMRKSKRIIWHTGTSYRLNPESCNNNFANITEMTMTDQTEFLKLGAKNIHYMACAIDTDKYPVSNKQPIRPFTIGHYPSNETVKGTDKIIEMLTSLPFEFVYGMNKKTIPHKENLSRIADCDIYIELFAPTQHGKEYGCFVVTAFEAAALGKIVITQNNNEDVYKDAYGDCPFLIANTEEKFKSIVGHLLSMSENYIKAQQEIARERLVKNHSLEATGERWVKLLAMA